MGREEAAGWQVPHPRTPVQADVFTVRSGLGKKCLEALGDGSFRCLQGHTWEVSRSGLGSCMGPAKLNCKDQARNSTLCNPAAMAGGAVPEDQEKVECLTPFSQPTVPWVFPHSCNYLLCNGRQGPHCLSLGFSSCDMSKGKTLTLYYCHCKGLSLGSSSTNNFESEGGSDNN